MVDPDGLCPRSEYAGCAEEANDAAQEAGQAQEAETDAHQAVDQQAARSAEAGLGGGEHDDCPPCEEVFEAGMAAAGAAAGFIAGGGAGAALAAATGGPGALAIPATAVQGATTGAMAGLAIGQAISPFLFSSEGGSDPTPGLRRQLVRHQNRLDEYRANPDAFDNRGFLRDAPNEQVRQSIIQGRIENLQRQIANFFRQIKQRGG